MGIVDDIEVLKKHPEIFDKEGIIKRKSLLAQAQKYIGQLEGQVKDLQGDLQTAQRESVQDRKRVAVEKFKGRLSKTEADAKATNKVQASKLANAVKLEMEKLGPMAEQMQWKLTLKLPRLNRARVPLYVFQDIERSIS